VLSNGPGETAGVRRGVRLGVDVGDVRIGVAASDPHALLATPLETVPSGPGDVARLAALVAEHDAIEVIVGLPRSLSGAMGAAAEKAVAFAERLVAALGEGSGQVSVRLVDERLTTVSADRVLREQGRKGRARRQVVDQAAAVVILQHALETERSTGRPPGQEVGRPRE
jgi:putative Holliday junction resolvase